jgi:hypothetical protein
VPTAEAGACPARPVVVVVTVVVIVVMTVWDPAAAAPALPLLLVLLLCRKGSLTIVRGGVARCIVMPIPKRSALLAASVAPAASSGTSKKQAECVKVHDNSDWHDCWSNGHRNRHCMVIVLCRSLSVTAETTLAELVLAETACLHPHQLQQTKLFTANSIAYPTPCSLLSTAIQALLLLCSCSCSCCCCLLTFSGSSKASDGQTALHIYTRGRHTWTL